MSRRLWLIALGFLFALASQAQEAPDPSPPPASPAVPGVEASVSPKPKGAANSAATKKSRAAPSARQRKPAGQQLARHLEGAVGLDAQSRALEAQYRAVSARYATSNSITPGSPFIGGTQRRAAAGNLRNYNETEVEAGMQLWLPGQRDAYENSVTGGLLDVEERMGLRRLEVAGLLRDSWWSAQRAARDVQVARTRVATARDVGADMTRRVDLGDAAQADALLARNELLAAETELAQAEGAAKVARVTYQALTGMVPDGVLESVRPAGEIEDHPALRAPRAALLKAQMELQLVEASPIDNPEVSVFGRQEHNDQFSTGQYPVTDQRTDSTTVGVRLRVPLPTAGRNEPKRAAAQAEIDKAGAEYERAKRVVTAEIKAARASLAAAQKAAGAAKSRLSVANEQFELSRKAYSLGEISAFDLYRVRQLHLEAQKMFANADVNVGVAASRVNQALGYSP